MPKRIGFLGVGAMGQGMVRNLLQAGFAVTVFDVNPAASAALAADGASVAGSVAAAVGEADVVMSSLPTPAILLAAALGPAGAVAQMQAGAYLIDLSTVDPGTIRRVSAEAAARGVHVLDAPVSGGPGGAEAGTLSIMVGGEAADFEACRDVLAAVGKRLFHVGPIGAGQTVKICNNMLLAVHAASLGEALVTGVKAGVELQTLVDVMRTSSGASWVLENFVPKTILRGDYSPLFALDLMHKDLGLYVQTADSLGVPSPMGALAYQLYTAGRAAGMGRQDMTAVVQVVEQMAGYHLPVPR